MRAAEQRPPARRLAMRDRPTSEVQIVRGREQQARPPLRRPVSRRPSREAEPSARPGADADVRASGPASTGAPVCAATKAAVPIATRMPSTQSRERPGPGTSRRLLDAVPVDGPLVPAIARLVGCTDSAASRPHQRPGASSDRAVPRSRAAPPRRQRAGLVERPPCRCGSGRARRPACLRYSPARPSMAHGRAERDRRGQRQRARARDDEHGRGDARRWLAASGHQAIAPATASATAPTVKPRAETRADRSVSHAGLRPAEDRVVPQTRQLAVRHVAHHAQPQRWLRATRPPARTVWPARDRRPASLAGHERIVDRRRRRRAAPRRPARPRCGRTTRQSPARRCSSGDRRRCRPSRSTRTDSGRNDRNVRSNAIALERLLLEEPADQQEEHEARERIEEPLAAAGRDVGRAAHEQRRQADRDRHVERHRAGIAQRVPRAPEIVRRAEAAAPGWRSARFSASNSRWKPPSSGPPLT